MNLPLSEVVPQSPSGAVPTQQDLGSDMPIVPNEADVWDRLLFADSEELRTTPPPASRIVNNQNTAQGAAVRANTLVADEWALNWQIEVEDRNQNVLPTIPSVIQAAQSGATAGQSDISSHRNDQNAVNATGSSHAQNQLMCADTDVGIAIVVNLLHGLDDCVRKVFCKDFIDQIHRYTKSRTCHPSGDARAPSLFISTEHDGRQAQAQASNIRYSLGDRLWLPTVAPAAAPSGHTTEAPSGLNAPPSRTESITPTKRNRRNNRTASTPSKHCHICCRRLSMSSEYVSCGNLADGTCRKTICEKCFSEATWPGHVDATTARTLGRTWKCTHCTGTCPERAQCFVYARSSDRRRKRKAADREAALRPQAGPSDSPDILRQCSDPSAEDAHIAIPPQWPIQITHAADEIAIDRPSASDSIGTGTAGQPSSSYLMLPLNAGGLRADNNPATVSHPLPRPSDNAEPPKKRQRINDDTVDDTRMMTPIASLTPTHMGIEPVSDQIADGNAEVDIDFSLVHSIECAGSSSLTVPVPDDHGVDEPVLQVEGGDSSFLENGLSALFDACQ